MHADVIKYLAPLVEYPNAKTNNLSGITPIYFASLTGHLECIKVLAPFCENPNTPNFVGRTPIQVAEEKGYVEIKRILQSYIVS